MIIDSHVHIWLRDHLPDSMVRAYLEPLAILKEVMDWEVDIDTVWPEYTVDAQKILDMLKDSSADLAVALPIDFNIVEAARIDIHDYNTWVFESCAPYADKIIPFIGVDPQRGEEALKMLDHFTSKYDALGVKLYPSTGWYPYEERIESFYDRVEDLGLAVITHAGAAWGSLEEKYTEPNFWSSVLENHPDMNIVIAHLGGKWRQQTFELCQKYPNCYTDCSALQGWLPSDPDTAMSRLKEVAEKVPDKVCYGSDFPLFDLSYSSPKWLDFVRTQPWADEDIKAKMLGGNMRKVLGI
jgi:uncharacterized protein